MPKQRLKHNWDKSARLFRICRVCYKVENFGDIPSKYCTGTMARAPSRGEYRKKPYRMKKEKWIEKILSNPREGEP